MNLTKYFNRNYMIQNLKKSKSILAFFLGILPIISILSYLTIAKNSNLGAITLESISIVHYFGIYFVPIILSVCLFGFVYKKKSVDFINSMPLSRKTIFTTNIVTGILLLILMVILSGLGIYITSTLINTIMPFRMIIDYILVWSISYIFVFILSNIAMSVSGNTMTQIAVTLLILFFVPFLIDYITAGNILSYSYNELCIETTSNYSNVEELCNIIYNTNQSNYTLPYNNIHSILYGNWNNLYNLVSIVKMFIISLAGYTLGKFLFLKRKMENNETSFKKLEIHNIVKALTMFPIIAIISIIVPESNISALVVFFILLFLVIYFIIYDLITRKSISNFKKSFIHFCIILCVLFPICITIHVALHDLQKHNLIYIDDNQITEIKLSINSNNISEFEHLSIKDKEDIDYILKKLNNSVNSYDTPTIYKEIIIETNNNNYKILGNFQKEDYNEILNNIKNKSEIQNAIKLLDNNKIYAVGMDEDYLSSYTNDSKIIKEAVRVLTENPKSLEKCKVNKELSVYAYDNGKVISTTINSCASNILNDYTRKVINKKNQEFQDRIKYMSYTNVSYMISYNLVDYNIDSIKVSENLILNKIYANTKQVYSFMKKYNDNFDTEKEYIYFHIYLDGKEYSYYTNRVEELLEMLEMEKED